jgi:hypothetical protein
MIALRAMGNQPIGQTYLLDGSGFSDNFTFVEQLAFADVSAMAYMDLTGGAVFAQSYFFSFIMRPSFGTALLGMSSFRIWHILIL